MASYGRLIRLITLHEDRKDDAGRFTRRLRREIDSLWTFLIDEGVSPTNNHAERMLRFSVLWRKRSQGTGAFAISDNKLENEKDVDCGLKFLAFSLLTSTDSIKKGHMIF